MRLLLALLFCFSFFSSVACKCNLSQHPIIHIKNTKDIFEGTVIDQQKDGAFTNYVVLVTKNWKGNLKSKDTVEFTQGINSCAKREFELGQKYVFFKGNHRDTRLPSYKSQEYISNCSYTQEVNEFKGWKYLENIDLIEKEHTLYFQKKKKFLFFTKYEQISGNIFKQYEPGAFYGPRKRCITDDYVMRNNFFETACLVKIAHATYFPINSPSKKMKRFLNKISQEKLEIMDTQINH